MYNMQTFHISLCYVRNSRQRYKLYELIVGTRRETNLEVEGMKHVHSNNLVFFLTI